MSEKENKGGRPKSGENPFTEIFRELVGEDVTQQEVADKIGVTRQNVGKWLSGITTPDIVTLVKIADAYGVSTDYLLGRTDIKTTDVKVKSMCDYTGLSQENIESLHVKTTTDHFDPRIIYYKKALKTVLNSMLEELLCGFGEQLAVLGIEATKKLAFEEVALKLFCKKENLPFTDDEIKMRGKEIFKTAFEEEDFKFFAYDLETSFPHFEEISLPIDIDYRTYQVEKEFSYRLEDILMNLIVETDEFYIDLYSQFLDNQSIDSQIELITQFYMGRFPDEAYRGSFERKRALYEAIRKEQEKLGKHNTPQE